jgi:hypothetical protein
MHGVDSSGSVFGVSRSMSGDDVHEGYSPPTYRSLNGGADFGRSFVLAPTSRMLTGT